MKIISTKKAFTLIELLVVITIMGILATGATTIYTSQIQKARDSTRLTDIKALQGWVEQFYQDEWSYPDDTNFDDVIVYVPKLPTDPKSWQASWTSVFEYLYNVSADDNFINAQEYEISTHFEQAWNITWKAATDWWGDDARMEIWINVGDETGQSTDMDDNPDPVTGTTLQCIAPAWWATSGTCDGTHPIVVMGNPAP